MHFPLIHTGRRFFFFTFVVEGRRKVLSHLEHGAKRPALTALGELPVKYDPSVEDSRDLAAHRELILSSFTAREAPPFVIRRPLCLAMNARTAAMVAGRGYGSAEVIR